MPLDYDLSFEWYQDKNACPTSLTIGDYERSLVMLDISQEEATLLTLGGKHLINITHNSELQADKTLKEHIDNLNLSPFESEAKFDEFVSDSKVSAAWKSLTTEAKSR